MLKIIKSWLLRFANCEPENKNKPSQCGSDVMTRKKWVTVLDERTRINHAKIGNRWINPKPITHTTIDKYCEMGYRPKCHINRNKPPQGGSGVPNKQTISAKEELSGL